MQIGASFPEAFASALRIQNAALSRRKKSLALAGAQKSLAFMVFAMAMRRLFGSCGGAARQDAVVAADVAEAVGSDKDPESLAARSTGMKTERGIGCRERAAIK